MKNYIFLLLTLCSLFAVGQPLIVTTGTTTINTYQEYDYIQVDAGATLVLADGADVKTTSDLGGLCVIVEGTLLFGESSTPIAIGESVELTLTERTRFLVRNGGLIQAYGPTDTDLTQYTSLASNINVGTNSFTVDNATGWNIGDTVAVTTSTIGPWETEERVITNVAGTTITVDDNFDYFHDGTSSQVKMMAYSTGGAVTRDRTIDARSHVANLTRPISIRAPGEAINTWGADIMVGAGSNAKMEGVQFYRLGQAKPSTVEYAGGSTVDSYSGRVQPGRYALHWHKTGATGGDWVQNCTFYRSRHKSITTHQTSNVLVSNNVTYKGWSHQIVAGEDGHISEFDITIDGNLCIYARRVINSNDEGSVDFGFKCTTGVLSNNKTAGISYQLEIHPGVIMAWTPGCTVTNNIVAGGNANIAYYFDFNMGRKVALGNPLSGFTGADTAGYLLPADFEYVDEADSILVKTRQPVIDNNVAYGMFAENNGKTGVSGDVGQKPFGYTSNAFLSYRPSGGIFWMDEGTRVMLRDKIDFQVTGLTGWNCSWGIWNEYSWATFDDVYIFGTRFGVSALGGYYKNVHVSQKNLLGAKMNRVMPFEYQMELGNITGTEDHFQGYTLGSPAAIDEYEDLPDYPGFVSFISNLTGDSKIQKGPTSIKDCSAEGYKYGISVNQNFEGPFYVSNFACQDCGATRIKVNWNQNPFGSTTVGSYEFDGNANTYPFRLTSNQITPFGAYDGAVFDLDTDSILWANGTGEDCSGWAIARLEDAVQRNTVQDLQNFNDPDPWYTTNPAKIPAIQSNKSQSAWQSWTAIVPINSSIATADGKPYRMEVYGCKDNVSITVDGQTFTYVADQAPEGFNVNLLRGGSPTTGPSNPGDPNPGGRNCIASKATFGDSDYYYPATSYPVGEIRTLQYDAPQRNVDGLTQQMLINHYVPEDTTPNTGLTWFRVHGGGLRGGGPFGEDVVYTATKWANRGDHVMVPTYPTGWVTCIGSDATFCVNENDSSRFLQAFDKALASFKKSIIWTHENAVQLGVPVDSIMLFGNSAGTALIAPLVLTDDAFCNTYNIKGAMLGWGGTGKGTYIPVSYKTLGDRVRVTNNLSPGASTRALYFVHNPLDETAPWTYDNLYLCDFMTLNVGGRNYYDSLYATGNVALLSVCDRGHGLNLKPEIAGVDFSQWDLLIDDPVFGLDNFLEEVKAGTWTNKRFTHLTQADVIAGNPVLIDKQCPDPLFGPPSFLDPLTSGTTP